jgi:hypothetical protein
MPRLEVTLHLSFCALLRCGSGRAYRNSSKVCRKSVCQECPPRVSQTSVLPRLSPKRVFQDCLSRVSLKSVLSRVRRKSVSEECPNTVSQPCITRVSQKSVSQECQSVWEECLSRLSLNSLSQEWCASFVVQSSTL